MWNAPRRACMRRPWSKSRVSGAIARWLLLGSIAALSLAWIPAFTLARPDPFSFHQQSVPITWTHVYLPTGQDEVASATCWWCTVDSIVGNDGYKNPYERLNALDVGVPLRCFAQCEGSTAFSLYAKDRTDLHGGWRFDNRWLKKDIPTRPSTPASSPTCCSGPLPVPRS